MQDKENNVSRGETKKLKTKLGFLVLFQRDGFEQIKRLY